MTHDIEPCDVKVRCKICKTSVSLHVAHMAPYAWVAYDMHACKTSVSLYVEHMVPHAWVTHGTTCMHDLLYKYVGSP